MNLFSLFGLILLLECKTNAAEKRMYISTERPTISYWNNKYLTFVNITAHRTNRRSRVYYVDSNAYTVFIVNNTLKWDIFFYELWGNTYRRTFLEMHYGTCDLIMKDMIFGTAVRKVIKTCPIPPGPIRILNATMTSDYLPQNFPFTKGRIYVNASFTTNKDALISGYIDMEVKHYNVKTKQ